MPSSTDSSVDVSKILAAIKAEQTAQAANAPKTNTTTTTTTGTPVTTPTNTTTNTPITPSSTTQIVSGTPQNGQINIADWAGQVVANPSLGLTQDNPATTANESMSVSDRDAQNKIDPTTGDIDKNDPNLQMDVQGAQVDQPQQVEEKTPTQTNTYEVDKTEDKVAQNQMEAAQGQVSQQAQITDVPQADMQGLSTGINADGSINYTGQALKDFASINLSNIIDTSTSAGKLLAEQLGEGNYVDSKATLKGQLDILQSEFVGPNGEPKIPTWAAATARNVSKIAAFGGMTGTAATAAMAQALMEASLPIAQQDSQFFQTLTIKNLDNKQQATLNAANVLAKFEQTNLDNRMTAAVQNAQSFLAMDLKNLDNEQQARVINNQSRIQSILEDSKQENAKRLFESESQNDLDKFYASLNTSIEQFNSSQLFEADKFNSTMEDSREKFYKEMQYNIALSNAKWRQTVQLQEDQQAHEAATTDVKNMFDLSINQLNQLWDRSDALLDYVWKSSESAKDRNNALALAKLQTKSSLDIAKYQSKSADKAAIGELVGTFIGSETGGKVLSSIFSGLF